VLVLAVSVGRLRRPSTHFPQFCFQLPTAKIQAVFLFRALAIASRTKLFLASPRTSSAAFIEGVIRRVILSVKLSLFSVVNRVSMLGLGFAINFFPCLQRHFNTYVDMDKYICNSM